MQACETRLLTKLEKENDWLNKQLAEAELDQTILKDLVAL